MASERKLRGRLLRVMNTMSRRFWSFLFFCSAILFQSLGVQANVVVGGTRVVYPAKEREVSVRLTNQGAQPALVQAWIDAGNPDGKPDDADVPFIVMPPMVRIDPGKGQALRLAYTPQPGIPKDRESVFWLNILDVPPLPSVQTTNHMQLAFRSRLKVFFRPLELPGSAIDTAEQLHWRLVKSATGMALQVRNDGAFHVSFNTVLLKLKDGRGFKVHSRMLAPRSTADFALEQAQGLSGAEGRVVYEWINDYGATVLQETRLAL